MNLYKLTQKVNSGWDTYDSVIVAAETEDQARLIRPDGWEWENDSSIGSWAYKPEQVKVELIGIASPFIPAGVILASYNAG